jgi:hypothetical protein
MTRLEELHLQRMYLMGYRHGLDVFRGSNERPLAKIIQQELLVEEEVGRILRGEE